SEGHAFELGASDVVTGKYDPHVVCRRVDNIVELNRYKWNLEKTVEEQTEILRHSNDVMVDALSSLIEYRSVESGQHILRIRRFTQILMTEIARSCPEYKLDEKTVNIVASASALHDIGKIAIPDSILNKPGKLTDEEREIMKTHSLTGSKILEELDGMGNEEYLRYAHNICHYHHERWDGKGYPEGISGDAIPICAQVVGLADCYDALTNKRVYKDAYSHERAVNMILQGECGIFSPKLMECFKNVNQSLYEMAKKYADGRSPKSDAITVPLPGPEIHDSMDTLEAIQTKYHVMLHYIDATVVELNIDEGVYHLVYNPYPELAGLTSNNSFEAGIRALIRQNIPEENQGKTLRDFFQRIRTFLDDGLRKQEFSYRMYSPSQKEEREYEVVFLRLRGVETNKKRMIMIWRRLERDQQAKTYEEDQLPEGIGLEGVCRYRNDRWLTLEGETERLAALLGYSSEELKIRFQNRLYELLAPEEQLTIHERIRDQLKTGKTVELEYRMIHKDGRSIWLLNKSRLTTGEDGKEYLWGKVVDVTKTHYRQGVLQQELDRCKILLSQVDHVTFDWDMIEDKMIHSERWMNMFGYVPIRDDFSKKVQSSHLHPEDVEGFLQCLQGLKRGEPYREIKFRMAKADGRYLWCKFRATTQFDQEGNPVRAIGVILDIDETERATQALQERAERDSLTGILNKKAGQVQVEKSLEKRGKNEKYAMLIIDLDNFKQVNDRYGHMFGDAVLSQAAQEIRKQFRMDDIAARIGGDEFMVFMKKVPDRERVKNRCEKLVKSFRTMFEERIPGSGLTCSIGIAMAPDDGIAHQELYHAADKALYQAKKMGKNQFAFYDMETSIPQMETTINQHIDSNEESMLAGKSLIHYTFHRLYQSGDVEGTIQAVLGIIGKQMNVSRVYIFENDSENKYCFNTFEWCNTGIHPEIDNLQFVSYETDIPGYEKNFDERGIFYCPDIRELPKEQYDILEPQGIKSMLQCAIRDNGVFRGYVGFDECVETRLWTKEQIDMLTFLSEVLSVFLLKHRAQLEIEQKAEDLNSILDNQNAWIYVVEPDTYELLFINEKTQKLAPTVKEGMTCYRELRGFNEPCPDCPMVGIRDVKSREIVVMNDYLDVKVLAEATLINWKGNEASLLTCWELKE
ncbi:MAG: diguanylate cyclase, partial [Firmicutes bacterium]|nr:diguanylate cyclase [Bacillota bacterium]